MANVFRLKHAEEVRTAQTVQKQKQIKKLYTGLSKDIAKEIRKYGSMDVDKAQLMLIQRDTKQRLEEINRDIQDGITDSMITTANAVVQDTQDFLKACGFHTADTQTAFLYIPDNVVRNIVTGDVYQEGWSLSEAIWGHTQAFNEKLSEIVSLGAAKGKSAYEIALDLEKYVNPTEAKPSRVIESYVHRKNRKGQWVIEKDKQGNPILDAQGNPVRKKYKKSFYFGQVDYNAQRLARTMISHAYQQSFEAVNRNDPFVIGYRWLTSNFHGRVCEICRGRAQDDRYGLGAGIFPKDQLPLDHPNGMCTFEAVLSDSLTNIADMIGKWYEAPTGTYPDIDQYAQQFMY